MTNSFNNEDSQEYWKNTFEAVNTADGYEVTWTVMNFFNLEEKGDSFDSPSFGESEFATWYFRLFPRFNVSNFQYVSLFLHCCSSRKLLFSVDWTFALLNKQGSKMEEKYERIKFDTLMGDRDLGTCGKVLRTRVLQHYLYDGRLTFYCQISPKVLIDDKGFFASWPEDFSNDMNDLFENGLFSDFTLLVQDKRIKVHKCILVAHSSLFASVLRANKECISFRLMDDYPLVREMVQYMYTGESPNAVSLVPKLLRTANKFRIPGLIQLCADALSRCIEVESAAEILQLAKYYNLDLLSQSSVNFIKGHTKEVMCTRGWDTVASFDAWVLSEVLVDPFMDLTPPPPKCITVTGGATEPVEVSSSLISTSLSSSDFSRDAMMADSIRDSSPSEPSTESYFNQRDSSSQNSEYIHKLPRRRPLRISLDIHKKKRHRSV